MSPLPDDFEWKPRSHLDMEPTGLFLHGELVASMLQRVDGSWMARLHPEDGVDSPLILRPCRSFESGQRGCEMWAARHETALRVKLAKKLKWVIGRHRSPNMSGDLR